MKIGSRPSVTVMSRVAGRRLRRSCKSRRALKSKEEGKSGR
jgi:hypothetical protein